MGKLDITGDDIAEAMKALHQGDDPSREWDPDAFLRAFKAYNTVVTRLREFVNAWAPGLSYSYPKGADTREAKVLYDWSVQLVALVEETTPSSGLEDRLQAARRAALHIASGDPDVSTIASADMEAMQEVWMDSHTSKEQMAAFVGKSRGDDQAAASGCSIPAAVLMVAMSCLALSRRPGRH